MDTRPRIVSTRGEGFGSNDRVDNEYGHEYNEAAKRYAALHVSQWAEEEKICRQHEEALKNHPEIRSIETIIVLND